MAETERLNAYRNMWLLVLYDLPTETIGQRRAFTRFRKDLQALGFSMFQFSAYISHVASRESADAHKNRIRKFVPEEGAVCVLEITDKQFEKMELYLGRKRKPPPEGPRQLELF